MKFSVKHKSIFPLIMILSSFSAISSSSASLKTQKWKFTKSATLKALGNTANHTFFGLNMKIPASWVKDKMAMKDDPLYMERLILENRSIAVAYKQYYKHRIFAELWLKKLNSPESALKSWMQTQLKNRILTGNNKKLIPLWSIDKIAKYKLSKKRYLYARIMVGGVRASAYTNPVAIQLTGIMLVTPKGSIVLGTGLASEFSFNSLSVQAKQIIMKQFSVISQQLFLVGSLAKIKIPPRKKSFEKKLKRRGKFIYASRYSSQMGTVSTTNFSQYSKLAFKFKGHKCSYKDDFSTIYVHTRRSALDAPGTGPRSITNAGGGYRSGWTNFAKFEVRGTGGKYWLVIYHKSMPVFYTLSFSKKRKCSKKTVRGLSIGGKVEGIYSTWGVWCVYKSSKHIKL